MFLFVVAKSFFFFFLTERDSFAVAIDCHYCCREEQLNRVRALWRRQLAVPLLGIDAAWEKYKEFEIAVKVRACPVLSVFK